MTATLATARDEMFAVFKVAWDAGTALLNGGVAYPIRWDGVDEQSKPITKAPWALVGVQHTTSGQSTLSNDSGARRWTRRGIVTVDIFIPLARGDVSGVWESLATISRDAFEGVATTNSIWFRDVRTIEGGPSEQFYRGTVIADFEYDESR